MDRPTQSATWPYPAAIAALIVLAAVVACTKVWNYDVFWHLAAGDWMLAHGQVLRSDPFAVSELSSGPTPWLNVHWLFQVAISLLHGVGGFAALTAMKMVMLAGMVWLLAIIVGRRTGAAWLLLCGVWMILGVEARFRIRPEVFSLVFLLATLGVLESVRTGSPPRRLWWLAPIFVVWVNMHGLYFLGPLAAVAAVVGWFVDRRLGRIAIPDFGIAPNGGTRQQRSFHPTTPNTNPPLPRGAVSPGADATGGESPARETNSPRRKAGVGAEPVGWDERSESHLAPPPKGGTREQRSFQPTGTSHPTAPWVVPIVVAIAACFIVSPFPVSAAMHPLTLASRVIGAGGMYKFGVQELRPTYLCNPLTHTPVLIAAALAVATIIAMAIRGRSVPTAHVIWLVLFGAIGLLAVRNVAFFVVPAAMLLALHGPRAKERQARNPKREVRNPKLEARNKHEAPSGKETSSPEAFGVCGLPFRVCLGFRISDFGFAAALLVVAAVSAAYATEAVYRWQRRPEARVGFGLVEGIQPVEMARWLEQLPQAGAVLPLEFGHGGTMIYFCPSRQVWMDGRLELHSAERFRQLGRIRRQLDLGRRAGDPDKAPLPPEVRFIVAGLSETRYIESLRRWPNRFQPVYADRVGVCFARIPQPGEHVAWPTDPPVERTNLDELDRPLRPEMFPLLTVETRRRWYRQNVPPAHWQTGAVLNLLVADPIAWRYLAIAERLKLAGPAQRLRILAQSHQRVGELRPIEPGVDFPADPNLSRAFALYDRLEAMRLDAEEAHAVALARLRGQMNAGQFDAADATAGRLAKAGGPAAEDAETVASCRSARLLAEMARQRRDEMDITGLLPAERALLLMRKDVGLIDEAIAALESAPDLSETARMQLGDLRLRVGRTGAAGEAYRSLPAGPWQVRMRLGLCAWAEGDLAGAIAHLENAAAAAGEDRLAPRALLAALHEQMGDYAAALKLAGPHASGRDDPRLPAGATEAERLLRRVAARLLAAAPGEEGP